MGPEAAQYLLSWLPVAPFLFGSLLILLGISSVVRDSRRRSQWQAYTGRVVGTRLDDGTIQCRIAYVRDGREYVFWNPYSSSMMTDPVGREVQLLANPSDPLDAMVSQGLVGGGSAMGVILILFGALALGVGFFWFR